MLKFVGYAVLFFVAHFLSRFCFYVTSACNPCVPRFWLAPGPGSWSWLVVVALACFSARPAISHPCAPLQDDFISLLLLLLLSILIDSLDLTLES